MSKVKIPIIILCFYLVLPCDDKLKNENDFVIFKTNPKDEDISFYWKDNDGKVFKSIDNLKKNVEREDKNLKFAMNGGMFEKNNLPKGLYIQDFKILNKIDTLSGEGNFYLNPNGIFYLTKNNDAELIETKKFKHDSNIKYATQSGPMLLINDEINPIFKKDSKNLNIRNGVGILKNGNVVFVMSKNEVNFYNFASIFKQLGCKKALYLDGFVSRTYYLEGNWIQKDGDFGVMIGITESKK
ncbi:phosphodiester glycosidase family protein [Chryseobacterium sp. 3008163]|uniref:phosphodiester glycosidase family protein n=1 Tax=Chryseobacterium sp. 3008163 TaxID=2478663 RepID=UPI000F0C5242|nr:hypothetical protein EAG08_08580 [Chryseobacterium sp. 3008163]